MSYHQYDGQNNRISRVTNETQYLIDSAPELKRLQDEGSKYHMHVYNFDRKG